MIVRRRSSLSLSRLLALTLTCSACADDGEIDGPDAQVLDAGRPRLDAGASGSVPVDGVIQRLDGGPIEGARVCIVNHPEIGCGVSRADGGYEMELPVWSPPEALAVHVAAPGRTGATVLVDTSPTRSQSGLFTAWIDTLRLEDEATLVERLKQAALRYPAPDKAFVMLGVSSDRPDGVPAGATVSITPSAGAQVAYTDEAGRLDPAQRTLCAKGGGVLFGEVTPGPFEVSIPGCRIASSIFSLWDGSQPSATRGTAVAGSVTYMAVACR